MRLKKSYDYFKTLKDMSLSLREAFSLAVKGADIGSSFIKVTGMRSELSQQLLDEFTAPIERDDIYSLSALLYEELLQINHLSDILSATDFDSCSVFEQGFLLFDKQIQVFKLFGDTKHPERLLKTVSEVYNFCNRLKKENLSFFANNLKSSRQPLLEFSVGCAYIELLKSVSHTLYETERVVINNN